jgi:hypothetical protein
MTGEPSLFGTPRYEVVIVREKDVLLIAAQADVGFAGIDSKLTEDFVRKAHERLVTALR